MTATGPKNITEAMLKAALRKHAGVFVLAARELGCDRSNICLRVGRSPDLQAYIREIEDEIGDVAVGVILGAIVNKQDIKTAKWYAERKLRHLGFTTRQELTGADGAPLNASPSTVNVTVQYVEPSKPATDPGEVI